LQGASDEVVASLARGVVPESRLSPAETALLDFVRKVTREATGIVPEDTARLRAVGWSDAELAEAVYVAALFAFFNRVADAFGLPEPGYLQLGQLEAPATFDENPNERRAREEDGV
jgi:alkylhydroperoxidase family enzyme